MTKKFTEEEYQKIVKSADRLFKKPIFKEAILKKIGYLDKILDTVLIGEGFSTYKKFTDLEQEFALIALPKSREWAHEQFVEKEKKYYWRHKKKDEDGDSWYLKKSSGIIYLTWLGYGKSAFTEREIIEAGYNLDMFDKEEVD